MRAFTAGLGVKECWVALYNGRQQQLMISASAGYPAERRLPGTPLGPCRGNAWGDWLISQRRHDMDATQQSQNAALVPAALEPFSRERAYHLLPLTANGVLLGLIYVSNGANQPLLDAKRAAALVKTVDCLHKAFESFRAKA